MTTYDLGAIVEQKREAVGSEDVTFEFKGETFTMPHPLFADDDFKDDVAAAESDVDLAITYLGVDQYDKFRELGGKSGFVGMLLQKVAEDYQAKDEDGNPTRSRRSSARGQKRQKRR